MTIFVTYTFERNPTTRPDRRRPGPTGPPWSSSRPRPAPDGRPGPNRTASARSTPSSRPTRRSQAVGGDGDGDDPKALDARMKEASREGPIDPSSSPYDGPAFLSTSAHADSPTGAQDIIVTSASSRMPRATISLLLLGMRRGRASRARTKAPRHQRESITTRRRESACQRRGGSPRGGVSRGERADVGRGTWCTGPIRERGPSAEATASARAPRVCGARGCEG